MIGLMLKLLILSLLAFLPVTASAALDDGWFDPAYLEANTLDGGTGFIEVPSPEVIPGGVVSVSIHRYEVKVDYGLWDRLELGIAANLDGYEIKNWTQNQLFYGRLRLLDSETYGVGLSLGADGLGPSDFIGSNFHFVAKPELSHLERYYAVAGAVLPLLPSVMLTVGWETGSVPHQILLNLSKVVMPGLLAMAEYDGQGTNLGARMLLSPRVKLDLDFFHTQDLEPDQPFARVLDRNIFFGITYSEPWPARNGQDLSRCPAAKKSTTTMKKQAIPRRRSLAKKESVTAALTIPAPIPKGDCQGPLAPA